MSQIRISTTGTLTPVPIDDLGAVEFTHPLVDFVIYDSQTDESEFNLEEIRDSLDLQNALDLGYLTMDDELGNPITNIAEQIQSESLDGDGVHIDWVPSNYTRDIVPTFSDEVTDLTSHLKGIDDELLSLQGDSHTHANKTELDLISDGDHDIRTDNPHGVDKTDVGLSNVPNTDATNVDNHVDGTTNKVFTDLDNTKLDGIEAGAEVNVQSDWNAVSGDALILNKPTDITDLSTHNVTELSDVTDAGSGAIITTAERNALHDAVTLGGVANDTTDDTLDLTGQELTVNLVTTTTDGAMSGADKLKLDGIESGATADQDASEVTYSNTTSGLTATDVQGAIDELDSTLDGLGTSSHAELTLNAGDPTQQGANLVGQELELNLATITTDGLLSAEDKVLVDGAQQTSEKGQANGYASLDAGGKVPASELPSYVDDVLEVADFGSLPPSGETGKIYVTIDDNKIFRWTGSVYVEISADAGAPVSSVNTQTGAVVLDTDDINEGVTNLYYTEGRVSANTDVAANTTARHDAVTLNAGQVTQDTLDLATQEIQVNLASATTHGAMSLSDKSKLDGIEANAKDDQIASEVSYSNATSGLTATEVQSAIDEIDGRVDTNETDITNLQSASHSAVTLNSGDPTQQSANIVGQELELVQSTPTTDGVMSSEDKSKLDGVEAGAEVNTVDSVNGETGVVVLDADDIDDTSTAHKFVTAGDVTNLGNLSGTNTGDQNTFLNITDGVNTAVADSTTDTFTITGTGGITATVSPAGDSVTIDGGGVGGGGLAWCITGSRNTNQTFEVDMLKEDGLPFNESPFIIPVASELKYITIATNGAETWTGNVLKNGVIVGSVSATAESKKVSSPFTVSFASGDEVRLRMTNLTGGISKPSINAFFQAD